MEYNHTINSIKERKRGHWMTEVHTLREWRKLKELTIAQMAEALSVTPKTYLTWERCPARIKIGVMIDICNILKIYPANVRIFSAHQNVVIEGEDKE